MWPASPEALAALRGGYARSWRLDRLDPVTLDLVDVFELSSSIVITASVSAVRERRNRYSVTGSILDPTRQLPWTRPGDPLAPFSVWRLEAGVWLPASLRWEWIPQATTTTRRPRGGNGTVSFSGADMMSRGDEAKFTQPTTIERGRPAAESIRDLLIAARIAGDPARWSFDDGGRYIDADVPCERDEVLTEKAELVARHLGLVLHTDRLGFPVLYPAPTSVPAPSWSFERGASSTFVDAEREVDFEGLKNHTQVVSQQTGRLPFYAEARVTDPRNPIHERFVGDRKADAVVTSLIGDQATADALALSELLDVAMITDDIELAAVPCLVLDPLDVVRVTEPRIEADHLDSWLDEIVTGTNVGDTQSLRSRQVWSVLA